MTSRRPHDAPPPAQTCAAIRILSATAVVAALLLQILLPGFATADRGTAALLAFGDALCVGSPSADAIPPGGEAGDGDGSPAPPDGRRHGCCVLCTSPGLAAVTTPAADAGPAWSRAVAAPPVRPAEALVAAVERAPVRPRAPPAA